MAGLTDDIEAIIRRMLDENNGIIVIGRNELAGQLHCVPSQINYVLTTRFTSEQGYFIESKRGGNGGIKISRVQMDSTSKYLMKLNQMLGDELTAHRCDILLKELAAIGFISDREVCLLNSSYSEKALKNLAPEERLKVRCHMMKNMISCLMSHQERIAE